MNEIRLYGTVGGSFWDEDYFTASDVAAQIAGISGPLTVRLNSGGGYATEGQAIYTILSDYPGEVHMIVDSVAMSAASLIAMAGDRITMRRGSVMVIHDPAQGYLQDARGTEADHLLAARHLGILSNAYAAVYAARAGIGVDEARKIMRDDTMLDGATAVLMGFADDTDDTPAEIAATFDYRIYAKAPKALRMASEKLGHCRDKAAILAMLVGTPHPKETIKMPKGTTPATAAEVTPAAQDDDDITAAAPVTQEPVAALAATATASVARSGEGDTANERRRAGRISAAVAMAGLPAEMATTMIDGGITEAVALDRILAAKQEKSDMNQPLATGAATVRLDARDKFVMGATKAIMMKAGMRKDGERNEFSSMSLSELARVSIDVGGARRTFDDKAQMIGHAFTMAGAHSTSDFGNILANVMHKSALRGWEEAVETFPMFTSTGALTDFRQVKRVGLGLFSSLEKVEEGANYTHGTIGDRGEPITLATFGRMIKITRQAIINDDLSLLGDLPRKMGRAARRTVGNLVYAIINGNPVMSDGVALFHASHGNLAGSGAALSVASVSAAVAAMMTQKESAGGSALNIRPRYLLVPAALETLARQLMSSTVDPTATKGMASNPVAGVAEVIVDARLDATSATAWYMIADPNAFDGIEVAYLDGNEAPFLDQMNTWTSDGVEMKVRIDAAAAPMDWRTIYKNPGA